MIQSRTPVWFSRGRPFAERQIVKIIYRQQLTPQSGEIGAVGAEVPDVLRPCVEVLANRPNILVFSLEQQAFRVAFNDPGLERMGYLRSAGVIIINARPGLKGTPRLDWTR